MYEGKYIRLAVVDNDRLTLAALVLIIKRSVPSINVIWTSESGREAVQKSLNARTSPDVLLVDMSLEGMSGLEICRRIRAQSEQVALIGITSFSLERYAHSAIENGAQCLIDKVRIQQICDAICALANGRSAIVPHASHETKKEAHIRLATRQHETSAEDFTGREQEIMDMCVLGKGTAQIAQQLGISQSTVKTHIQRVIEKMHVESKTQAVIRWVRIQ
ncbi:MAG: response regulator transcription factor [Bifidobacterium subtile]|jgi:DNA-binding NarL/FixJ family response regulator|nr:response regulator transcription factor [Bifidobacterium subtile]